VVERGHSIILIRKRTCPPAFIASRG
jgi:hypothetical protein